MSGQPRLLPWSDGGGKTFFLKPSSAGSFLSRLADDVEAQQLGMAEDLLDHLEEALGGSGLSETEWRNLGAGLGAALRDVVRVAKSRGQRIPPGDGGDGEVSPAAVDQKVPR